MRVSIILVILLLMIVGFLMVYNAIETRDRDATFSKVVIMVIGIMILGGSVYLLIRYLMR